METQQGLIVPVESAALGQGSPAVESAGVVPENLQQFVATPSAVPSDAPGQGGQQGGESQTGATQPTERERQLQSLADQRLAESLRYQREAEILRQQPQIQQPQQQVQENPFDQQTQGAQWWKWEKEDMAQRSARLSQKEFMSELKSMAQQNAEYQWQMSHPNVDVNTVKAFARSQGIAEWNLEASYKLMTLPDQLAGVAQTTAQNAFSQFRQPQTGAVPLRGGAPAGNADVGYDYAKLAAEYQRTNGEAAKSWPPELVTAFRTETYRREVASRQR